MFQDVHEGGPAHGSRHSPGRHLAEGERRRPSARPFCRPLRLALITSSTVEGGDRCRSSGSGGPAEGTREGEGERKAADGGADERHLSMIEPGIGYVRIAFFPASTVSGSRANWTERFPGYPNALV